MSFSYGNKLRHKSSGRHFKLFSDELPRIEFDRASLEEYTSNINEQRRSKGTSKTFRDANHDRFSLPSLGTPEWDILSETEKNRPHSYSPLNPNFAKIHQKIKRRHTSRETKANNGDAGHVETFRNFPSDVVDKQQYTTAWHETVRKSKPEHDNINITTIVEESAVAERHNHSVDSICKNVVDKPPVPKKKSIFRELLDASAKESVRMNRIKEGLNFHDNPIHRQHSLKPYRLAQINRGTSESTAKGDVNGYEKENIVPEHISQSKETAKPGILKHGVRVRETVSTKRAIPVKHRLVHQDDIPIFGQEGTGATISSNNDEVRMSVYADTPMNRMKDMMFVPLPSTKPKDNQKRVNFHEHVEIKERTAMSDLIEFDTDNNNEHNPDDASIKTKDVVKDREHLEHRQQCGAQIRRRKNVRHLHKHTVTIKHSLVSKDTRSANNETSVHNQSISENNAHQNDKQDYIDSILLAPKPVINKIKHVQSGPAWKLARPSVTEILIHEPDPLDIIANANSPVELTPATVKTTNTVGRNESLLHSHIPLSIPKSQDQFHERVPKNASFSPSKSPINSPPRSATKSPPNGPDIDTLSEFTAVFDDEFDFDELTNEIDRSMLGEDLIKAYRFWDRKRKVFTGGLRKIETPVDRNESVIPKQYGNVKTYRILNKPPIAPSHSKPSQNNVLMHRV